MGYCSRDRVMVVKLNRHIPRDVAELATQLFESKTGRINCQLLANNNTKAKNLQ